MTNGQGAKSMKKQQYLLSIYQPDGPPPPPEFLEPVMRNVARLTKEMQEAGVWVFASGLCPPETATVVRLEKGEILTTDGPYLEGKEHIGGFTVIRAADLDEALEWGRKVATVITGLAIEVRPMQRHGET
jgi:hypothetical protein